MLQINTEKYNHASANQIATLEDVRGKITLEFEDNTTATVEVGLK